jgi:hypothetical protein
MSFGTWKTGLVLAGLLFSVLPAAAQFEYRGIQLSTLNGTLGAGYSDGYGNQTGSNHSLDLNGNATLNGSYFNPKFLAFSVSPYYGESRANSNYRSVADSSGVTASTTLFSGSNFPGSISYGRDYNSSGDFAIPGQANVTTHGNGDTFGVSWGINLPKLPVVSASYSQGNSQYSLYGSNGSGTFNSRQYGVHSNYLLEGFHLNSSYSHSSGGSEIPAILQTTAESSSASSDGYSFGFSHSLPLNGGANYNFNHSSYSATSQTASSSGGVNNMGGSLSFNPVQKLSVLVNANYTDNLAGLINETILSSGAPVQETFPGEATQSLNLNGTSSYSFRHGIGVSGLLGRAMQSFQGQSYASTIAGGSLSTIQFLFGGTISGSLTATDNLTNAVGSTPASSALGLNASLNVSRNIGPWETGGAFGYTQNQQTLLISYLTSAFSYNGHVYRRIKKLRWSASAGGGHNGFVQQAGSGNVSESFGTSLSGRLLSGNVSYSRSSGTSVLTPTGLVALPTLPILGSAVLFDGQSYSMSAASSPIKNLTLSISYAEARSNTLSTQLSSTNQFKSIFGQVGYHFRQMSVTGGYSQLIQGFSSSGVPPANVSSFFIGVSRWLNFF